MSNNAISLTVAGKRFEGWHSISITRALEAICGAFELGLSDRLTGEDFSLYTQSPAELRIGDDLVMSGFVDAAEFSIDKTTHSVTLRGRDRTSDLVDCSVALPLPSAPKGTDLFSFFQRLVKAFPVKLSSEVEPQRSTEMIKVIEGETVAEVIIRLCKDRGWLPITSEEGKLVITASGKFKATDPLTYGVNVLSAQASYDYSNRFSTYILTGQKPGVDATLAETFGGSLTLKASFADEGVKRVRPLVLQSDGAANTATMKKRAQVEALVRAANSQSIEVIVQGWRQSTGELWKTNRIVSVKIPPLYVSQELLITEVAYLFSGEGSVCRMKLKRPDAFNPGTKFKGGASTSFQSAGGSKVKAQKGVGFDAYK